MSSTLHSRHTVGADALHIEFTAPCPLSGGHVPLETCVACFRCHGFTATPDGQEVLITCQVSAEDGASVGSGSHSATGSELGFADRAVVAEIMTKQVICVTLDLDVATVATLFLEKGISGAPVVDDEGRPIGIVSKTNLVRFCYGDVERPATPTVADIMMPLAFCLPANESIAKAAALMACEQVHRLPVVSSSGQVIGIVSSIDVLTWLARAHGYVLSGREP